MSVLRIMKKVISSYVQAIQKKIWVKSIGTIIQMLKLKTIHMPKMNHEKKT